MVNNLKEGKRDLVLKLLDDGLSVGDVKRELGIDGKTVCAYKQGFKSVREYCEHLVKEKGFKSLTEYYEHLVKEKGFESVKDYRRRPQLMAMLKYASIGDRYGEDALQSIIEECSLFDAKIGFHSKDLRTTLAAATYGILRKREEPVTLDDVAELFGMDKKSVASRYRAFYAVVDGIPLQNTKSYIKRGVDELGLSEEVGKSAFAFFEENMGLLRRFKPTGSAGACIYLEAKKYGKGKTQKEIADSLNVTTVTLRNITKVLKENQRP